MPKEVKYDCLEVTSIQINKIDNKANSSHILANADIVLNDQLVIRGLRIMDGLNGLFVGYPNTLSKDGDDFRTVANPITRQLRENIENKVLEKYQESIAK